MPQFKSCMYKAFFVISTILRGPVRQCVRVLLVDSSVMLTDQEHRCQNLLAGSTQATLPLATQLETNTFSLRVLSHPRNKGEWNLNQGFHSKMSFLFFFNYKKQWNSWLLQSKNFKDLPNKFPEQMIKSLHLKKIVLIKSELKKRIT